MALTELNAANGGMGQAQFGVTAGGMRGMGMGYDSQG